MTQQSTFAGEDENAGYASPRQDMLAAAVLIVLSVWVMAESLRLESPGSLATAPGLLPFLTAASLCGMALGLGLLAIRRHRRQEMPVGQGDSFNLGRTAILAGLVGAYLVSLELIYFDYRTTVFDVRLGYGAFEVLTILLLTALLGIFWRRSLWRCLAVAVLWSTALAAAFRYVFVIPLPGSV